jgi:pimeloyl-ACP methyl ester carboxylesterase
MTTLVLLHAFPLDASMYDAVREPLSSVCDLVTPDLAGFGGRVLPVQPPSLDVYADELAALLDENGLEDVVLGGTSMGGYTAMAFLRRHPGRVTGVVLLDTKASADAPEAVQGRLGMASRLDAEGTPDALLEATFPKLIGATSFERRPAVVADLRGRVEAAPPAAAAWAQRAMAGRADSLDVLRATAVPSLVVVGEEDVLSPPDDARAMAQALPDADLVVLPSVGHLTPLEAPAEVAEAIAGFLRRLG